MAVTTVYVDFDNGSDTTGDGTSWVSAWATWQHAITNTSRGTDGTICMTRGTGSVASSLNFGTSPTAAAPWWFVGDSGADVTITAGLLSSSSWSYVTFCGLKLTFGEPGGLLSVGGQCITLLGCTIIISRTSQANIFTVNQDGFAIIGSHVSYSGTPTAAAYLVRHTPNCQILGNWIDATPLGVYSLEPVLRVGSGVVAGNVLLCHAGRAGIGGINATTTVVGNTIVVPSDTISGTTGAILGGHAYGNLVRGFAYGLVSGQVNFDSALVAIGNRYYNCGSRISGTALHESDEQVLSSDPFVDFATGDYTPVAGLSGAASYPRWPSLAGTIASSAVVGAIQAVGGSVSRPVLSSPFLIGGIQ